MIKFLEQKKKKYSAITNKIIECNKIGTAYISWNY